MKEHIEKSSAENEEQGKEIVQLKSTIQEKDMESEGLKEDISKLKSAEEALKEHMNAMAAKEADLDMELNQVIWLILSMFIKEPCWPWM